MKRIAGAEQYFTAAPVVSECLTLLNSHFDLDSFDLVLEPSAGAGAFLTQLPRRTRLGLDIFPMHDEVKNQDFLEWHPESANGRILTIGNPPFGTRGKLAVKFVEHAASFSNVIAFILPRSFQKYTFQNRVPAFFHLVTSLECSNFVTYDGVAITVNSVFQIWEKRQVPRELTKPERTHSDFHMKHAHLSRTTPSELARLQSEFDFAIPQVGANFTPREPNSVTKGSYWFIKGNHPKVRRTFETLDFTFLDGMNTAHKSLAKADIVTAYQAAIGNLT